MNQYYNLVMHLCLQEYLESEGIEVNPNEELPQDPYITKRTKAAALQSFKTPSDFDKQRQFLEMDRKVLRFYCVWDDRDNMFGEMRKFIIHVSGLLWYNPFQPSSLLQLFQTSCFSPCFIV